MLHMTPASGARLQCHNVPLSPAAAADAVLRTSPQAGNWTQDKREQPSLKPATSHPSPSVSTAAWPPNAASSMHRSSQNPLKPSGQLPAEPCGGSTSNSPQSSPSSAAPPQHARSQWPATSSNTRTPPSTSSTPSATAAATGVPSPRTPLPAGHVAPTSAHPLPLQPHNQHFPPATRLQILIPSGSSSHLSTLSSKDSPASHQAHEHQGRSPASHQAHEHQGRSPAFAPAAAPQHASSPKPAPIQASATDRLPPHRSVHPPSPGYLASPSTASFLANEAAPPWSPCMPSVVASTPPWAPGHQAAETFLAAAMSPTAPLSPSVVAVRAVKLQAPSFQRPGNTPSPGPRAIPSNQCVRQGSAVGSVGSEPTTSPVDARPSPLAASPAPGYRAAGVQSGQAACSALLRSSLSSHPAGGAVTPMSNWSGKEVVVAASPNTSLLPEGWDERERLDWPTGALAGSSTGSVKPSASSASGPVMKRPAGCLALPQPVNVGAGAVSSARAAGGSQHTGRSSSSSSSSSSDGDCPSPGRGAALGSAVGERAAHDAQAPSCTASSVAGAGFLAVRSMAPAVPGTSSASSPSSAAALRVHKAGPLPAVNKPNCAASMLTLPGSYTPPAGSLSTSPQSPHQPPQSARPVAPSSKRRAQPCDVGCTQL